MGNGEWGMGNGTYRSSLISLRFSNLYRRSISLPHHSPFTTSLAFPLQSGHGHACQFRREQAGGGGTGDPQHQRLARRRRQAVLRRFAHDLRAIAVRENEAAFVREYLGGHRRMGGEEEAIREQPVFRPF